MIANGSDCLAAWIQCTHAPTTSKGDYAILDAPCNQSSWAYWDSSEKSWRPDPKISITIGACHKSLPMVVPTAQINLPTTHSPTSPSVEPTNFPTALLSIQKSQDTLDIKWIIITIFAVCLIILTVCIILICDIIKKRKIQTCDKSKHKRINNKEFDSDDEESQEMVQLKNVQVRKWLQDECDLTRYLDNFLQNGYDSINIISAIDKIEELEEIGITLKGHQKMLCMKLRN